MKITIIGAGNMGRAIGGRAMTGGHEVEIVDGDPAEAEKLATDLGGSATALEPDAPFDGEVVVYALYYPGIKDAAPEYADRPAGKVVVDISNPVDTQTWDRLATPRGTFSAEEVAEIVPAARRSSKRSTRPSSASCTSRSSSRASSASRARSSCIRRGRSKR